jgi:molybdopterin-containing oxidoreductase family iron-sulfur binding subunit
MGASLALAGLTTACTVQPTETIVPYVRQPEAEIPGKALYFATAMPMAGVATALLVRSNEGRPTKIEGNPDHPENQGATDLFAQASILNLYDPDRSQTLTYREEIRPWTAFVGAIRAALDEQRGKAGAGLRFLTEAVSSPSLAAQMKALLAEFPAAKWYQYEPAGANNVALGANLAFGQPVNTLYRFDRAARIFAIDSDFLNCGPGNLRYARDFATKRRVTKDQTEMNRLYAVECTPTNTGAKADHRLAIRPSEVEAFTRAVANAVGANAGGGNNNPPTDTVHADWIAALARDLQAHRGACVVITGGEQSPMVHALAHAMNAALGNVGQTVFYTDPLDPSPADQIGGLRELVGEMDAGRVDLLVMLGGNPVYNAPVDFGFSERLQKVKLRVHHSIFKDETSALCHWHIPATHYLEEWSDARSSDGTVSIIQPLIAPLYNSKSAHEVLAVFSDQFDRTGYDIVRGFWQTQSAGGGDFETFWRRAVHDGIVPNTALQPKTVSVNANFAAANTSQQDTAVSGSSSQGYEIVFRADPSVYDGRYANNGWLQELPKPLTKLTWDNAAYVSPRTAKALIGDDRNSHGATGRETIADVVELKYQGRSVKAPVVILPGQPDNVVTIHLGYGRERAGRVGGLASDNSVGFNAYKLRTSDALWHGTGLQIAKTGETMTLASTQAHFNMENRDVVRETTLEEYLKDPNKAKEHSEGTEQKESAKDDSFFPQYEYKNQGNGYAWGMTIDVSSCVGCNACVVACQSENNIPVVGKDQVVRSREMHWLRVDAYYKGADENNPEGVYFMPVPCMHCELAPCEPVCPVHATVHSAEGTNDMTYNRCVGTRYCSNNCPYKVRRFNFLLYQDWTTPTYKLMRNPEVTVRSRGVMEKCTYCIQRIQNAKIESERENRKVRDGEILTACQAVCPTDAIVFGNINDPQARVSQLKAESRNYSLLTDLNTQPRTTYLSAMRNPNPEIGEKGSAS